MEETASSFSLREGVFCGPSSGAMFIIALRKAKEIDGGTMVVMHPDGGKKYLGTQLCDLDKCIECAKKYGIRCGLEMIGLPPA